MLLSHVQTADHKLFYFFVQIVVHCLFVGCRPTAVVGRAWREGIAGRAILEEGAAP